MNEPLRYWMNVVSVDLSLSLCIFLFLFFCWFHDTFNSNQSSNGITQWDSLPFDCQYFVFCQWLHNWWQSIDNQPTARKNIAILCTVFIMRKDSLFSGLMSHTILFFFWLSVVIWMLCSTCIIEKRFELKIASALCLLLFLS